MKIIKHRRLITGMLIILLGSGLLRGCVFRPATNYPGSTFNRGENATWLGVEWVNQPHSQADFTQLAAVLHQHRIRTVFVYVTYLKADGTFNQTYAYRQPFLSAIRRYAPDVHFLAWIGLPWDTVDLNKPSVRDQTAALCRTLTDGAGFDGIHLDPEPIENGNTILLTLLDQIRSAMPPGKVLSLATHVIAPIFPAALPNTIPHFWSSRYYRQVAAHVDQIAVMTYDSGLPLPEMYRLWTRFQVIQLSQALNGVPVQVLIGLSVSDEDTATHHPVAENILSGLQGLIDGLNDADSQSAMITGVAVYPYWEIDPAKWSLYDQLLGVKN